MSGLCGQPTEDGTPCRFPSRTNCPHHRPGLTDKQRRFVEEYTVDWNATQAAIRAGYSEHTARAIGSENLTKPDIADAIKSRMDELAMTADEALVRLANWGRAEDVASLIEIDERGEWRLNLKKAEEEGKLYLIKELSYDSDGRPTVKMYDAKDAVKQIARAHGLFVDRVEHTGAGGGPIVFQDLSDDELREHADQLRNRLAALDKTTNGDGQ